MIQRARRCPIVKRRLLIFAQERLVLSSAVRLACSAAGVFEGLGVPEQITGGCREDSGRQDHSFSPNRRAAGGDGLPGVGGSSRHRAGGRETGGGATQETSPTSVEPLSHPGPLQNLPCFLSDSYERQRLIAGSSWIFDGENALFRVVVFEVIQLARVGPDPRRLTFHWAGSRRCRPQVLGYPRRGSVARAPAWHILGEAQDRVCGRRRDCGWRL